MLAFSFYYCWTLFYFLNYFKGRISLSQKYVRYLLFKRLKEKRKEDYGEIRLAYFYFIFIYSQVT